MKGITAMHELSLIQEFFRSRIMIYSHRVFRWWYMYDHHPLSDDPFYVTGARNNELRRLQPLMEALTRWLCNVFGKVVSHICELCIESDIRIECIL